ncbi:hypothetical protein DFJ74DRAFT_767429 [Hyaloraphidium curvatum]|nr:hypothetical protein DFJ74DRAFT_767429 [Hyaloraphidium curvatum]
MSAPSAAGLEEGSMATPLLNRPQAPPPAATSAYAWLTHFGTAVLMGLLTAFALKLFGPPLATAAVLLAILVLVLAYYGYVKVNLSTIRTAATSIVDSDGDGTIGTGDVKAWGARAWSLVVGFGATAVAGFVLGFWMGVSVL